MLGEKKFRFEERREARQPGRRQMGPPLTEEDLANIEQFSQSLTEAQALLEEEIKAINGGQLTVVNDLFEQKTNTLKWLERKLPVIEPFLQHPQVKDTLVLSRLADLKRTAAEGSELLARMSVAARTIVREFEKASERNGLKGIYGKSGQKLGDTSEGDLRIDREF
jgi:hypothetical protein